jgi:hypothetical protein
MVGVDSPDHGPVLASTVYRDGDTVPLDRFIQPRIEAEIVFVLGARLQGPGRDGDAGARGDRRGRRGDGDRRLADRRLADQLADTVADLASNGAMATSSRVVPLDGLDTRLIGMTLTRNGELVDTGAGRPRWATPWPSSPGSPTCSARTAWPWNRAPDHDRARCTRPCRCRRRRLPRRVRPARPDHGEGGMTIDEYAARLQQGRRRPHRRRRARRPRPRHRLRGAAPAARVRRPARRLEAGRDEPGQAGRRSA